MSEDQNIKSRQNGKNESTKEVKANISQEQTFENAEGLKQNAESDTTEQSLTQKLWFAM